VSDVAAARCAAGAPALSTDVYAKCHILYLSCLNCSSLFLYFYTMAAAAAPPSLPAADSLSFSTSRHFTIFFVEFLIMHTRWSHIYLKAALFFYLVLAFLNFTPLFFEKKKSQLSCIFYQYECVIYCCDNRQYPPLKIAEKAKREKIIPTEYQTAENSYCITFYTFNKYFLVPC